MTPALVTIALVSLLSVQLVGSASNEPSNDSNRLSLIWPRAFAAGSASVVWLWDAGASAGVAAALNVTVRLADAERAYGEKSVVSRPGLVTPVELAIPSRYDGQLTIRVDCAGCRRQELPVHPLEPIQSLGVRLERAVYHPDDVVSIWVACTDQREQIIAAGRAESRPVQVAVHDPDNIIVKYWTALASSPLENLLFHLSGAPQRGGVWTVRASVGDVTAVESFRVTDEPFELDARPAIEDVADAVDATMSIESHFVELNFSPRTASVIQPGAPFAGEIMASTSEKGITVGLDVVDQHGNSVHHQQVHLNRTSSAAFTVPALANFTTNATLQGTLQSIDGQALDNQFVLATHALTVAPGPCNVQLFSLNGQYRFVEGELLGLAIYSTCPIAGNRINYAVTSGSSGRLIAWGQERLVERSPPATSGLVQLNLSIPVEYEMIPRAVVTVFFPRDERHLASGSLDIAVRADFTQSKFEVDAGKVNLTLKTGQRHCLYASIGGAEDEQDPLLFAAPALAASIEPDGFLRLLPKCQRSPTPWKVFGSGDLHYVRCFEIASSAQFVSKEVKVPLRGGQLTLVSVDADGKIRRSASRKLPKASPDWSIDFQLPASVRLAEEVVVDVTIANHLRNCSQVQLQMALNGAGVFVSNDKKFLQQPACLAPNSKSVYRVGIVVKEFKPQMALTVQVRGSKSASCCAPADVVLLDAHVDPVETEPITKSVRVLPKDFEQSQLNSYLFCLEENSFVSNASSFKYEVLLLGNGVRTVIFQASTGADLRLALGESRHLNSDDISRDETGSSYHIVLGGEDNAYSWISKQMNGLTEVKTKVATARLLRQDRLQTFWITWDQRGGRKKRNNKASRKEKRLTLGKGSHVGARPVLSIPLDERDEFRFIGFSTGWGFHGFFRVWGTDGSHDQTIRSLFVPKPQGSIAKADLTVKGGLMSVMDDMWTSKEETAPTLVGVLEKFYRGRTFRNKNRPEMGDSSAILQNILYYRSADGSFRSEEPDAGNLRLTALAVHALSSIQSYSDPVLLRSSLSWLHAQQNEDGSFGENATLNERLALTSFVLVALADVQHDDVTLYQVCSASQRFLEARLAAAADVKLIAPSAAALLVSHSSLWPEALAKLDSVYDRLLECRDRNDCLDEITYALAAYFHQNKHERVFDLMRTLTGAPWETLHPTDKVRAMKAWSKYSQAINDPVRNLNMHITFQSGGVTLRPSFNANESVNGSLPVPLDDVDGDNDTRTIESSDEHQNVRLHTPPLTYEIPNLPQNIETAITGSGCAVVQTKVQWTTAQPPASLYSPISIYSSIEFVADKDEPPSALSVDLCVKWSGNKTTDLRVRTTLFSSYVITNATSEFVYNTRYNYISADFTQIKPHCARCVNLWAIRRGLVRNLQPGRIEVYELDRPQEQHQFLLRSPSNSTVWIRNGVADQTRYLSERPVVCS